MHKEKGSGMYRRILVATDGSELAGRAVDHGIDLARAVGAEVVFVTVTEMWSALEMAGDFEDGRLDAIDQFEATAADAAARLLAAAVVRASAAGVPSESRHIRDREPARGIMETAELEDCDLIVMASHGRRGIEKLLLGSATAEVLTFSKLPVLVLR